MSAAEADHAARLVAGVQERRAELDAIIRETAPAFPVPQLAVVDRTILRIALYELLFNNAAVPVAAVINDAVELAKTFGSAHSTSPMGRRPRWSAPPVPARPRC